jgi:hypothetical protein
MVSRDGGLKVRRIQDIGMFVFDVIAYFYIFKHHAFKKAIRTEDACIFLNLYVQYSGTRNLWIP